LAQIIKATPASITIRVGRDQTCASACMVVLGSVSTREADPTAVFLIHHSALFWHADALRAGAEMPVEDGPRGAADPWSVLLRSLRLAEVWANLSTAFTDEIEPLR